MASRILTALVVVFIVFPVCYCVWFCALFNLVPPEFGMPTYEEEIELATMVGSVAFIVVPLFISIMLCGFLSRRQSSKVPMTRPQAQRKDGPLTLCEANQIGNPYQSPRSS